MDPQNANTLDPKLQATYERVMGTNAQAPAGQAAAPAPVQPVAPPAQPATAVPNQTIPQPSYTADTLSFQAAIQQPAATNPAPSPLVVPQQQSSGLLKTLYIIGGVVFFIVYTIVWIKIFNLPLPF